MLSTDQPILSIRDLTIRLPSGSDRANAVEGISLDVERGEIVCVVGESGSGKSVTAQAVIGLLPPGRLTPTAGSIRLLGENILGASRDRLRSLRGSQMGMIFQEPMTALNPTMTVGKQIDEVLFAHGRLTAQERAARVLDLMNRMHLPEPASIAHAYPHQLSGGQRQRVMIAIALALDPALLIADEPTTALDVTTQSQILQLLRTLQRESGMGVLFITHDFGVVGDIADRVIVMRSGEIVEAGSCEEILGNPKHPYTRALIDAVPRGVARSRPRQGHDPVLRVEKLSKVYVTRRLFRPSRTIQAVRNLDLEIASGEIVGVVGESGSGKSTVARCVARLIEPSGGKIVLSGTQIDRLSVREMRPHRRHVQVIFQDPYRSLNPRRRALESLIEGPLNLGIPRSEAIKTVKDLVAMVGLDPDRMDRFPSQFSGGQRQRLCIARALAVRPKLLIADEAVSALDVSVQAQVLDLIEQIRRDFQLAILFITHDLRVAAKICDTILVMNNGEVVERGATDEVVHNPKHPYTRLLFMSAPGRRFFSHSPELPVVAEN